MKEVKYIPWEELDLEKQDSFHDSRGIAAIFHISVSRKIDTQVKKNYIICPKIMNYRKKRTNAQYSSQPLSRKVSTETVLGSKPVITNGLQHSFSQYLHPVIINSQMHAMKPDVVTNSVIQYLLSPANIPQNKNSTCGSELFINIQRQLFPALPRPDLGITAL